MAFLYDQEICIRLKDLRLMGLLDRGINNTAATIVVSRKNALFKNTAMFEIAITRENGNGCLAIDFIIDDKRISQKITLIRKPNNLATGYRWLAICPITGNNCANLYLDGESFKSRTAIKNGAYKVKTMRFANKRSFFRKIESISKAQKAIAKMEKRYAKPYYRGELTKSKMQAIMAKQSLSRIIATI